MQKNLVADGREPFPFKMFLIYVLFYAGQAMYNVYLNLFLNQNGFSNTQLGLLSSVSTVVLVLVQPLWGVLSDKSKSKNQIVGMLLLISAIVGLAFYASKTALWLSLCVLLFNVFFNPAVTLQDNYTLEMLEGGRWDFGQLRLGGTLGYAACAALIGFVVETNYGQIFWMIGIFFIITGVLYFTLPRVSGHREKKQKVKYSLLLKDRRLVCMFVFNIVYTLGTAFSISFTPSITPTSWVPLLLWSGCFRRSARFPKSRFSGSQEGCKSGSAQKRLCFSPVLPPQRPGCLYPC